MAQQETLTEARENASIKVGDVFYTSWGYDQTNINFVKVVSIFPSGKTVKCRMMTQRKVAEWGPMAEEVVPNEEFGREFTMRIDIWNNKTHLRGSYPFASRPDGANEDTKRLDTFWKWEGEGVYQSHYA